MQCNQYLLLHLYYSVIKCTLKYHFSCNHLVNHELSSETLSLTYYFNIIKICVKIIVNCMSYLIFEESEKKTYVLIIEMLFDHLQFVKSDKDRF